MCISKVFKTIGVVLPIAWKVFKIVAILLILWFILSALNSKFNIFSGITYVFKGVASGISKLFSFIGVSAIR